MNKTTKMVGEFHAKFKHPILQEPAVPGTDRVELRYNLITEELKEFLEAAKKGDIVEVADALCDLEYVLHGTILEFGLAEKFPLLFAEVQRSNMSKACKTKEEAGKTIEKYTSEGVECFHEEQPDGTFLVYRMSDKKLLKSIAYSPANISGLLK